MTREQALKVLGLESDATEFEINMALRDGEASRLNGSDHAIPSRARLRRATSCAAKAT